MWLENRRRRKGEKQKLVPKYVGPYTTVDSRTNHTYLINRDRQESWQNECRLKLYRPCENPSGKAPYIVEPSRRPNMKGAVKRQPTTTRDRQTRNRDPLLDELFPPAAVVPLLLTTTPPIAEATPELPKRNHQRPNRVCEPGSLVRVQHWIQR